MIEANGDLAALTIRSGRVSALLMPVIQVIFGVTTAAVMGMGAWYVSTGEMDVGALVANSQYISMILAAIMMLALVILLFPMSYACARRIAEVLNAESSIQSRQPQRQRAPGTRQRGFDHVTFAYPGADEPVLKDISFESRAGEVTAIIGRTGCGKSSVLKLVPRLYDAMFGHIYVDGMDVKKYKLEELRSLIGYVPQKNVLFSGDVASNLRFGDEQSGEEQWREAAHIACANEFIEQKDGAYHAAHCPGRHEPFRRPASAHGHRPRRGEATGNLLVRRQFFRAGHEDRPHAARPPARKYGAARRCSSSLSG